ncbi:flagellar motor switch protein FliN [Arthrobacter livingstonensis]|uniref:Flagellar motor switch protein FliN n=1 Tax=Arthrobacter livingstonensis TaxID=670078 RepID=A0A2V5LX49_9MICC|nr:flagellar motor switch protein FliN [Arthrobacter livingstonensis]PYI66866.1 flagellar motor switch protein FliN [Arthrobacter livingstonensis]
MTPAPTLHTGAVDALARLLPASAPLESALWPVTNGEIPAAGMTTLTVDYLGAVSAELSLALPPATEEAIRQAGGSSSISIGDVLRPALEAAAETLGAGVLGDVAAETSAALFADPESSVFRISEPGRAEPFAWFAIRIRHSDIRSSNGGADISAHKMGRIHDVEMALSVVIGRTRMTVANVLGLEPGDVVDLDRSAGAPADILLNGRLIAHGEVVVVDQEYGVRVTKILDAAETID